MVFYCDVCSVPELTIVPNHGPPKTQSFNPDYHLMGQGQRWWGRQIMSSATSTEF